MCGPSEAGLRCCRCAHVYILVLGSFVGFYLPPPPLFVLSTPDLFLCSYLLTWIFLVSWWGEGKHRNKRSRERSCPAWHLLEMLEAQVGEGGGGGRGAGEQVFSGLGPVAVSWGRALGIDQCCS